MILKSQQPKLLPAIIIGGVIAISTASIFIRFAQAGGASSIAIACLRLSIAAMLLFPVTLKYHTHEIRNSPRVQIFWMACAGIFLAIHFSAWITSLEYTSVASSSLFVSTGPLWVAILSPILLGERMSRVGFTGLILSISGGVIIALADACRGQTLLLCPIQMMGTQSDTSWGNFLALIGAWAVSGYLMVGRKARSNMSLVPYISMVYGIAALVLALFLALAGTSIRGYPVMTYLWIILLAVIPQLIGHSALNWSLRFLPASFVAVVTLGEPIGAATLAYFMLNEIPAKSVIIGGFLILAGIFIISRQP